jgi:hypothetical protein
VSAAGGSARGDARIRSMFAAVVCVGLLTGCGLLPGGGGIGWPLPDSDLGAVPTAALPAMGTLDVSALTFAPTAQGTIVDPYGAAIAGVILCVGTSEADAVPLGETDASGAYSVSLDTDAVNSGSLMVWPFLPLTRFEPEGYVFEGVVLGGSSYDFKGLPAIYPVPPEKDCR